MTLRTPPEHFRFEAPPKRCANCSHLALKRMPAGHHPRSITICRKHQFKLDDYRPEQTGCDDFRWYVTDRVQGAQA